MFNRKQYFKKEKVTKEEKEGLDLMFEVKPAVTSSKTWTDTTKRPKKD